MPYRTLLIAVLAALLSACAPAEGPQDVRAVYTAEGGLWMWEPSSGATRLTSQRTMDRVRLSPDGRWIAATEAHSLVVIDTQSPNREVLLTPAEIANLGSDAVWFWWVPGHSGWLATIPTQRVSAGGGQPAALWITDVTNGQRWEVLRAERPSLRFSPDGQYVSVKTADGIDVVTVADGTLTASDLLTSDDDLRLAVQWAPDSGGLLTVGPQIYRGSFLSRPMAVTHIGLDGHSTPLTTVESRPAQLSLSPDGTIAAAIADKWLTLTDLRSGTVVARFRTDIKSRLRPQWAPDSSAVLYYDADHAATVGTLEGESFPLTTTPLGGETTIVLEWLDTEHVYILRTGPQPGAPERSRYWHYVARVGGSATLIVAGQPSNVNVTATGAAP